MHVRASGGMWGLHVHRRRPDPCVITMPSHRSYKYSVLSTVGTAGLNNVLTMIPARDLQA